jgi:hypothetical protein
MLAGMMLGSVAVLETGYVPWRVRVTELPLEGEDELGGGGRGGHSYETW